MARMRTQTYTRSKGFFSRNGVIIANGTGTTFASVHKCEDAPGPNDCQPLFIEHKSHEGGVINRPNSGSFGTKMINYVADGLTSTIQDQSVLGVPSTTYAATQAAARTNPSRPYVDLPVSVLELREIPMLVRDAGRNVFHQAASTHIKNQFGIQPMARDIVNLMGFGRAVERRTAEVERLVSRRGLRRTVKIGVYSNNGTYKWPVQSNGVFIEPTFNWGKVIEVKAHCRWMPQFSAQSLHIASQRRALVERALLGLGFDLSGNFDAATITSQMWELIPWSWLMDWCGGIGDYFMSQRNIIPASLETVVVLEHSYLRYSCPTWTATDNSASMSAIRTVWESKRRSPGTVAPAAHFPFLNGRQMGILGALATLRMRR